MDEVCKLAIEDLIVKLKEDQFCSAKFGMTGVLKRHIETVHERKKNHPCMLCSAKFGTKGVLKSHIETA